MNIFAKKIIMDNLYRGMDLDLRGKLQDKRLVKRGL